MTLALLILLIALQVLDVYTTVKILDSGGRELNPVLRWLINKIGTMRALLLIKALFVGLCITFYVYTFPGLIYGLLLALALYIAVVINNLIVLRKLTR